MEFCGRALPGKRWLLEWIVVTVGWSHHHPCLAVAGSHSSQMTFSMGQSWHLSGGRTSALMPLALASLAAREGIRRDTRYQLSRRAAAMCAMSVVWFWTQLPQRWLCRIHSWFWPAPWPMLYPGKLWEDNLSFFSFNISGGKTLLMRKGSVENDYQEKEMWLFILKAGGSSRKEIRTWKDYVWWKVQSAF